ncbi:MAG: glycogen synthase GlgA [Armatimonadota bacterium]
MMGAPLKILFASAEVVPFAKTGGLADVAGSLPAALARMGHDVRIVMPRYGCIDAAAFALYPVTEPFTTPYGRWPMPVQVEQSDEIPGVPTYFIRNDDLFGEDGLYGHANDNHRFVTYCQGALEMLPRLGWMPDIIHCNDWHSGLIPTYLKTLYADRPEYRDIATLYTIHNLAYQGTFPPEVMEIAGLPWELFTWDKLEYYGQFNFMKAGLVYADLLGTVSKTYAREIQTAEFGEGLDGVLRQRAEQLHGIVNGIDTSVWNPQTDPNLSAHFSPKSLAGKAKCKRALQREVGLPQKADAPLLGIVSRLSAQKGLDLLAAILPDLFETSSAQVVILGTGDQHFQDMLQRLSAKYPTRLKVLLRFDDALAHRIYAGCDVFLMPSRYEPCGLGQLISLTYGTIPVVRATGGLRDTVTEFAVRTGSKGNGFRFHGTTPADFRKALLRALACYADTEGCWSKVVRNAMSGDFSWDASALRYEKCYRAACREKAGAAGV